MPKQSRGRNGVGIKKFYFEVVFLHIVSVIHSSVYMAYEIMKFELINTNMFIFSLNIVRSQQTRQCLHHNCILVLDDSPKSQYFSIFSGLKCLMMHIQ